MKISTNPVRGTVDYLPAEMDVRSYAEQIILQTYKQNGFLQIKTPILESLDLLTSGDSGDNQKLMFKTIKRGDKLDLTKPNLKESDIVEEGLRYDLTVPLVRFFLNNKEKLPVPFKAIQIDESFRAERPQRGRVRQFTQCDIDILGDSSPLCEVELLYSYMCAYARLGFKNVTIKVNDRRALNEIITSCGFDSSKVIEVCVSLDKLDKIGYEAVANELVSNGFEAGAVQKLMQAIEKIKTAKTNAESFEMLEKAGVSSAVVDSLKTIIDTASKFKTSETFKVVYDVTIIRGQGYYTGTVFEVYDEEFGRAIGGGGRYDKMIEKFAGVSIPAVGASIGLYSVVMLMVERKAKTLSKKLALVYDKNASFEDIMKAKIELMQKGYDVSTFAFPKNFNNFADKIKQNGYNQIVKIADTSKIIDL
ncbi:MAG: ATP phosphoribosyltransferase regulatory subunit [Clostridia bacterium]|nr:ATP phosphoribosyltransferase regulatory subunit [Clostridia bacterium]